MHIQEYYKHLICIETYKSDIRLLSHKSDLIWEYIFEPITNLVRHAVVSFCTSPIAVYGTVFSTIQTFHTQRYSEVHTQQHEDC